MEKVLSDGRVEMRASETESGESKNLKDKEFHEESNFSPKHS